MDENEDGKLLHEQLEVEPPVEEPLQLKHRLHGKQKWPPVLRALRPGGEWEASTRSSTTLSEEDYVAACKAECKSVVDVHDATALDLLQLEELRKVEKEEKAMMGSLGDAKLVLKVQKDCKRLEHRLKALDAWRRFT